MKYQIVINRAKRKLSNYQSAEDGMKKLRQEEGKSVTCIEDFSNELFYEIFDYLDGYDLYKTFANLNIRIQDLLDSALLRLKICIPFFQESDFPEQYQNFIFPNRCRLVSLSISSMWITNDIYSSITIDSSFHRLESLVLMGLSPSNLLPFLLSLTTLSRLFSLTIDVYDDTEDLHDAYQVIFSLPVLKYNKLCTGIDDETNILSSMNTSYPLSSLQYLIMDHACTLPHLIAILSCTPQLCHLHCKLSNQSNQVLREDVQIALPNLTDISIAGCDIQFDQFELFIKAVSSQLQVLRIITSNDSAYLSGSRWERLLARYWPYLRRFEFSHRETIDDDFQITTNHGLIHQFTSPFYTKRQWIIELTVNDMGWDGTSIMYSIQPYKKQWYELSEHNKIYSNAIHACPYVALTIPHHFFEGWNTLSVDQIDPVLVSLQITHLIIEFRALFIGTLIELLHSLPHLHSLQVHSLSLLEPRCLSKEDVTTLRSISNSNHITKVNLERMNELAEIQFLIDLCPRMEYLQIDYSDKIDLMFLVRFILLKTNRCLIHLCNLCLCREEANDKIISDLQEVINLEQLLPVHTIKRVDKQIYIQLK